jgi:hypothetical protein
MDLAPRRGRAFLTRSAGRLFILPVSAAQKRAAWMCWENCNSNFDLFGGMAGTADVKTG